MQHEYRTDSGAMSETFNGRGGNFIIHEIRLHLNSASAAAQDFTIDLDSSIGTAYDVNLVTQDLDTLQDFIPADFLNKHREFLAGDVLGFAWANSESKTWGLEIIWSE